MNGHVYCFAHQSHSKWIESQMGQKNIEFRTCSDGVSRIRRDNYPIWLTHHKMGNMKVCVPLKMIKKQQENLSLVSKNKPLLSQKHRNVRCEECVSYVWTSLPFVICVCMRKSESNWGKKNGPTFIWITRKSANSFLCPYVLMVLVVWRVQLLIHFIFL